MFEDGHLDSDYEDRYTTEADFRAEDSYYDDSDDCDRCGGNYGTECECDEDDTSVKMHEYDEMRYPEWTERSYTY